MTLKHLYIVGISHHTAQTDQRASCAWTQESIITMSHTLQQQGWVQEHVILSTCNRTEIICLCRHNQLKEWCVEQNMPPDLLYQKQSTEAITHILRTMTGLDSKIIGETEIIGQYKTAIQSARQRKTCTSTLFDLLTRCVHTARKIRSKMDIQVQSLAHCVFKKIHHQWPDLKKCHMLLIGAGHVAHQQLQYREKLVKKPKCTVLTRNPKAHKNLEHYSDVTVGHIDQLSTMLDTHNCVISATSSTSYVINRSQRISSPPNSHVYFDLAMPPDIEPANDACLLYTLDHLSHEKSQQTSIAHAETLINEHTQAITQQLRLRTHIDLIDSFRKTWLDNVEKLDKALTSDPTKKTDLLHVLHTKMQQIHQRLQIKSIPTLPTQNQSSIQYAKTLLHTPTIHIKHLVATGNTSTIQMIKSLNHLNTEELASQPE